MKDLRTEAFETKGWGFGRTGDFNGRRNEADIIIYMHSVLASKIQEELNLKQGNDEAPLKRRAVVDEKAEACFKQAKLPVHPGVSWLEYGPGIWIHFDMDP